MHLYLLELGIALKTAVWADEADFLSKLSGVSFQHVWWPKDALEEAISLAMLANLAIRFVGTLIAGECLTDTALPGRDGELLAHTAHQEVQLVRVVRR